MPVYNDWEALSIMVPQIDAQLAAAEISADLLVVDDGSVVERGNFHWSKPLKAIVSAQVLVLRRNVGHQRAIALGLVHVYRHFPACGVVVMDADGQDRPEDVPKLVAAGRHSQVVFAERTKRLESAIFQLGYRLYRIIHFVLTGEKVRFGNFSFISYPVVARLVVAPELWNHYAAAVLRCRVPYTTVPSPRGKRVAGRSTMNYPALVMHGVSALSVFADIIAARVLGVTALLLALTIAGMVAVAGIRVSTQMAMPAWVTYALGILALSLLLLLSLSAVVTLMVLNLRSHATFVPLRDSSGLIDRVDGPLLA